MNHSIVLELIKSEIRTLESNIKKANIARDTSIYESTKYLWQAEIEICIQEIQQLEDSAQVLRKDADK